jgi:asparagine synthase (glutamine-hydrolysing)
LPEWFDEPFADPSQIPTYILSEMTRQRVTVSLSGDGGDELFGGYRRYLLAEKFSRALAGLPPELCRVGSEMLKRIPYGALTACANVLSKIGWIDEFDDKVKRMEKLLLLRSPDQMLQTMMTHWTEPVVLGVPDQDYYADRLECAAHLDSLSRMQLLESVAWLPDDVLAKVDRASMAVGLEARVPLLDIRLVEFAWRLPRQYKVVRGRGKRILREVLNRYVPQELIERPKMGFGVPIGAWLCGPLREWSEDLLGADKLQREGFLDSDIVRRVWREHLSGERNWQFLLWDVLMFQAWRNHWHA